MIAASPSADQYKPHRPSGNRTKGHFEFGRSEWNTLNSSPQRHFRNLPLASQFHQFCVALDRNGSACMLMLRLEEALLTE
jgi:hypothetical protein